MAQNNNKNWNDFLFLAPWVWDQIFNYNHGAWTPHLCQAGRSSQKEKLKEKENNCLEFSEVYSHFISRQKLIHLSQRGWRTGRYNSGKARVGAGERVPQKAENRLCMQEFQVLSSVLCIPLSTMPGISSWALLGVVLRVGWVVGGEERQSGSKIWPRGQIHEEMKKNATKTEPCESHWCWEKHFSREMGLGY